MLASGMTLSMLMLQHRDGGRTMTERGSDWTGYCDTRSIGVRALGVNVHDLR